MMRRTLLVFCSLLITVYSSSNNAPVVVGVFIESLCPGSKAFVVNQLAPTFAKVPSIMAIELVTYGNAHYTIDNKTSPPVVNFTCQHGPDECFGNELQSCAIATNPPATSLAFVNCLFSSNDWQTPSKSGEECAKSLKLNFDELNKCASGELGTVLELVMAELTDHLQPPHTFVPWITINGKHTDDIQTKAENDLLGLVCETYTGTKPKECTKA